MLEHLLYFQQSNAIPITKYCIVFIWDVRTSLNIGNWFAEILRARNRQCSRHVKINGQNLRCKYSPRERIWFVIVEPETRKKRIFTDTYVVHWVPTTCWIAVYREIRVMRWSFSAKAIAYIYIWFIRPSTFSASRITRDSGTYFSIKSIQACCWVT